MSIIEFDKNRKHAGRGKLFIVSGPSGVGKNTVIQRVLQEDAGLTYVPSITTREKRSGEKDGDPYIFVTADVFEGMIERNELMEWERIHKGKYYGSHLDTYKFAVENGYDIIKDIDVNGALNIKKLFGADAILVFVNLSSFDELKQRLITRGDKEGDIEIRLGRVKQEIEKSGQFDHVVINDDLETAVRDMLKIVRPI